MSSDEKPCLSGETAEPTNLVIFGATGDLTKRKLMPALVSMLHCGHESRCRKRINTR